MHWSKKHGLESSDNPGNPSILKDGNGLILLLWDQGEEWSSAEMELVYENAFCGLSMSPYLKWPSRPSKYLNANKLILLQLVTLLHCVWLPPWEQTIAAFSNFVWQFMFEDEIVLGPSWPTFQDWSCMISVPWRKEDCYYSLYGCYSITGGNKGFYLLHSTPMSCEMKISLN